MKHVHAALSLFLILAVAVFVFSAKSSSASGTDGTGAAKTTSLASPAEQVVAREKAMWEAEKKKDKHAFESFTSDDYAEITADDGFVDRDTILKTFDQNGLQDYSLGPIKAVKVNPGGGLADVYVPRERNARKDAPGGLSGQFPVVLSVR